MEQQNTHRLVLMPSGRRGDVPDGITILEAARRLGVELEAVCGGRQTCGTCQVHIETGNFTKHGITSSGDHLSPPEQREQEYAEKNGMDLTTRRLACHARITGDVLVNVPESSLARKQVVRKAAGELTVEVHPAVRLVYVELTPEKLGGRADWERLQVALAEQAGLQGLTLDFALLPDLQRILREENDAVTVTVWQDREIIRIEPGYKDGLYGVAVDVGSTTIAAYLCDLRTGAVLATETMMNPQVRYGEDLISRISYAAHQDQGAAKLRRAVIGGLNTLFTNAAQAAGIDPTAIMDVVLVGNTVMHHILIGFDPIPLGHLPFSLAVDEALDFAARDLGLKAVHTGARVHVLPCIAGYVGADNVAVLLAEQPYLTDDVTLIVDIGTNAEILLGTKDQMLSASSPTGPAFEGAQISQGQRAAAGAIERIRIQNGAVRYKVIGDDRWNDELAPGESLRPTGICGSGIIEVVVELHAAGLIDSGGRFVDNVHPRMRRHGRAAEFVLATAEESASGEAVTVTQRDIRAVQLAKGALAAGVTLLMARMGVDHVDHVRLAGAFGSYIDPEYALRLGLIPPCPLAQVVAVGNAAGDGARIALLNREQRGAIQRLAREVDYIETAAAQQFQDDFINALALPDAADLVRYLQPV